MNELKFLLSVLFTKGRFSIYTQNSKLIRALKLYFRKEVTEQELNIELGNIIEDQMNYNNNFIVEIEEDFELNDI